MITSGISPDLQNLVKIRSQGASPRIGEIKRLQDFLYLFFFFLPSSTGKTTELILTHDGSYDVVSYNEVPFGGYKIYIQHFNPFFHKNMKNYNGAYGEN